MTKEKALETVMLGNEEGTVTHHLQDAIYHLASCWDALREAEELIGKDCEIETDDIELVTGDLTSPDEAYRLSAASLIEIFTQEAPNPLTGTAKVVFVIQRGMGDTYYTNAPDIDVEVIDLDIHDDTKALRAAKRRCKEATRGLRRVNL